MIMEFGNKCKDLISGFEGILTSRANYITGCDRVKLTNEENKSEWFDIGVVKVLNEGRTEEIKKLGKCNDFDDIHDALYNFGDELQDRYSKFKGKVVVISLEVCGDIGYGLTPKFSQSNKENDANFFDEGRLDLVKAYKNKIENSTKRTGGIAGAGIKYR